MTTWKIIGNDSGGLIAHAARRVRGAELVDAEDGAQGVIVSLPFGERADEAKRAASAGKHVIVAGALAASREEVETVVRAAESAGVHIAASSSLRYSPTQATLRASVSSGKVGLPGLVRVHHWESSGEDDEPLYASVASEIDLVLSVFESEPVSVFVTTPSGELSSSYVQIHLGFEGGGMALIDRSRSLPVGSAPYFSSTVIGRTGAAYADDHHNTHLLFGGGRPAGLGPDETDHAYRAQLADFSAAIEEGRAPLAGAQELRRAMDIAESLPRCLEDGRAVKRVEGRYEFV